MINYLNWPLCTFEGAALAVDTVFESLIISYFSCFNEKCLAIVYFICFKTICI